MVHLRLERVEDDLLQSPVVYRSAEMLKKHLGAQALQESPVKIRMHQEESVPVS